MPLTFLNPALLFGAAAAALPVIIHFLSRRRVRRLAFSDLRFLDEVQARQARSLGVRRWLLLLLRVLALLFVALAVAGPRWGGLAPGTGARSLLFVIDTSASMGTVGEQGTRLERALAECDRMIRGLPDEAYVQVVAAAGVAEPLFGDWLPAGAGAAAGLLAVRATDGTFDLAAALRETARQAARAPGAPVEIVLVSDLQEPRGDPAGKAAAAALLAARPCRILVRQIGESVESGGVMAVGLPRRAVHAGENVTLTADVVSTHTDQVFALELDGRLIAEAVAVGEPGLPARLTFPLTVPGAGLHPGVVRKESDAMAADDARPFVFKVPEAVAVLVVHGRDRPGDGPTGRGGWRFLAEALAPGGGGSSFDVTGVTTSEVTSGDVIRSDVVVLVDCEPLGRMALGDIQDAVRNGAGLLVLAGDPSQASYLESTLLPALELPGQAIYRSGDTNEQRFRVVDAEHPVFSGLGDRALGTLTDIVWRRWFAIDAGPGRVLLSLTGDDPLLVEHELGEGQVAVLASDLRLDGSSLAGSPMALPFFQRLVAWLAGPGRAAVTAVNTDVGQEASIRPSATKFPDTGEDSAGPTADGPLPGEVRAVELTWRRGRPVLRSGVVHRAGLITFRRGSDTLGTVAAGVPAAETHLPLQDAAAWREMFGGLGLELAFVLTGGDTAALVSVLAGRDLAPWFLVLALSLLLVELGMGRGVGEAS